MTDLKRSYNIDNIIQDNQTYEVVGVAVNKHEAEKIVNVLEELEDKLMETIDNLVKLQDQLNEANNRYDNILELIDIRIKENKQLALLHFPEPESEYVDEYDIRAEELEQLKKLILTGKK